MIHQSPPSVLTNLAEVSDISSSGYSSPQGYIEYNQTQVGLLGEAVINQDEFYDGEFSGSTLNVGQYYNSQYNPYLRVSKDSIANDRTVNLPNIDFNNGVQENNRLKKQIIYDAFTTGIINITPGSLQNTVSTGTYSNVDIQITSGAGSGIIRATVGVGTSFGVPVFSEITITNNLAIGIVAGDNFKIPAGQLTGQTNDITLNNVQQAALTSFTNITTNGFEVTNANNSYYIFLAGQPSNLLNGRKYNISFEVSNYSGNGTIGLSDVDSTGQYNLFTQGAPNTTYGYYSASFQTAFIPDGPETLAARISVSPGFAGTITDFNIAPDYASDSWWDDIYADIYLNPLQQDQWQIQNTQSIIFDNSDYNPLNNNVNLNRSSSTRLLLSYNDEQYQPENFQNVVTYSLDNTSESFFADVPDSNYTQLASINPRYNGSRLTSLDYNNFTPSGTIGIVESLPVQPFNKKQRLPYQSTVAQKFINGVSKSAATGLDSWEGDNSYGKTAVI